jgi:hypothetical protein
VVIPSLVEAAPGTSINFTLRLIDSASGIDYAFFQLETHPFRCSEPVTVDSSNRISGDKFDGTYMVTLSTVCRGHMTMDYLEIHDIARNVAYVVSPLTLFSTDGTEENDTSSYYADCLTDRFDGNSYLAPHPLAFPGFYNDLYCCNIDYYTFHLNTSTDFNVTLVFGMAQIFVTSLSENFVACSDESSSAFYTSNCIVMVTK